MALLELPQWHTSKGPKSYTGVVLFQQDKSGESFMDMFYLFHFGITVEPSKYNYYLFFSL